MNRASICLLFVCLFATSGFAQDAIKPIARRLPAKSDYSLPEPTKKNLEARLAEIEKFSAPVKDNPLFADVDVYRKAVEFAIKHGEFYGEGDIKKAQACLTMARNRAESLAKNSTHWKEQTGLVVRGYTSSIDGSSQPYGLVIPKDLDLSKPQPLYIWLHGRGDKATDLHFIHERSTKVGQISPDDAIVLHPFGRQCIGFKSAGEIDVLDAIAAVKEQYNIDDDRIVLMGFSMGGAGCWHIGAHYAENFVAMSPGAGFAETARYQNLKKEDYPPQYEQTLWKVYDVPNYTTNLFNLPVVAYSGENDKQIQAARVMEEAFKKEGQMLTHLIGPKMGHKYAPETLTQILAMVKAARDEGQAEYPQNVTIQTPTLRYGKMHWVELLELTRHWEDSRVGALWKSDDELFVVTLNVAKMKVNLDKAKKFNLEIDGQKLVVNDGAEPAESIILVKNGNDWEVTDRVASTDKLHKIPGLQGPIDDALMAPFLVVLPSGKSENAKLQRWIDFESKHLADRWQALFRGKLRTKLDKDVTDEDIQKYNLICWGTPETNSILKKTIGELPLGWDKKEISLGKHKVDSANHVPLMIYPNPLNQQKYLVINSGPTFRENHDRTNSLQNPKLPDWAFIDLRQDPDGDSPGKVVAADFFDEAWQP
ncbi:prolyl oligopeptidase family serine peptidase [Bremerella sp. P1]|uniref:carboxylesterase family protein n=1 Tax=Bremerella sp. P1 TaxID=3026424 RepID=UPI002367D45A|nr:prolyl oligopeptidase family serine peptidase [Bremerella sp. P1]WDI43996.1 prolyl oligopeptidase family serine peptidase [Bremerella sp. P1]